MSSNPQQFAKLIGKHFGTTRITGDPILWALVSLLAARKKMSLSTWVNSALRVALDALAPESVKKARLALEPPAWETAAAETWETPESWGRFTSRQLMCVLDAVRPEVEALISKRGSSSWNAARPGRILRAFIDTTSASPVFVLDEIEKSSPGNYDPMPSLLSLIEPLTAARFRDEFFDSEFDVSRAIFIATANDPERMDPALRSRFREIDVSPPTREQRMPIIASLWNSIRDGLPELQLPDELSSDVMDTLVGSFREARQVRRLIEEGLGRAAMRRGPLELVASDVGGPALRPVRTATGPASEMRPQS